MTSASSMANDMRGTSSSRTTAVCASCLRRWRRSMDRRSIGSGPAPPGALNRRLDIRVQSKQIGRVDLVLELEQARIAVAIGVAQTLPFRARLCVHVVAPGIGFQRLPDAATALDGGGI